MTRLVRMAPVPWLALLAAGCGSSEVPAQQLAASEAAIRAASELGADQSPPAALHLRMARVRLTRARELSRDGEKDTAARLLEQAEVDAELALALTRQQRAAERAGRAQQRLETLP